MKTDIEVTIYLKYETKLIYLLEYLYYFVFMVIYIQINRSPRDLA